MSKPQVSPIVSIIMPVYNGERYLREAIDSLLGQTFSNFELIIINDGSTDGTQTILETYSDPRIVCINNPSNLGKSQGISKCLNQGIIIAQGKYIARQDADDISLPHRLEYQIAYLDNHPEIGLLGSWIEFMDTQGNIIRSVCPPTNPVELKWALAFQNHFTHSSVMFGRKIIDATGLYNEEMILAQDYELWCRISTLFPVTNTTQILVRRRITPGSKTDMFRELQREYAVRVVQRALSRRLGEEVPQEIASAIDLLMRNQPLPPGCPARQLARLIRRCYSSYRRSESMTHGERRLVAQDAAEKLYILAGKALAESILDAVLITAWAERLSPRMPASATVRNLLSRRKPGIQS